MAETQGKILVVDDELRNVKRLEALLVPRGYEIVTASNGEEALWQVEQSRPDLILLDVMMPVMDGFAVCKQLKQDPKTLIIPVLMLTALDRVEDRMKGIEAGAEGFLCKPVRRDELLTQIRACLLKKQALEQQAVTQEASQSWPEAAASAMFVGCNEAIVNDILKQMRPRHFDPDAFLCRQGEYGESLFLIQRGAAEVYIDYPSGRSLVNRLGQGDVVGEIALLTGHVRIANVVALEPTDVLELTQENLSTVVKRYPMILDNLGRLAHKRAPINPASSTPQYQAHLFRHVFISHASEDRETAERLCQILEDRGIECWMAPRFRVRDMLKPSYRPSSMAWPCSWCFRRMRIPPCTS